MHQTDNDELLEMYLTSLTTSYDPHTTYMSPDTVKNFRDHDELGAGGHRRGAAVFTDGYTVVSKIIPGGAADKDKRLQPEDRIIGVGQGADGEIEDVMDMKLNDVVKRIRGKRGTSVRLKVIFGGHPRAQNYHHRARQDRAHRQRSPQRSHRARQTSRTAQPSSVGVINLPSFYMDMSGAREGLDDFKSTTRDVARLLRAIQQAKTSMFASSICAKTAAAR